MTWRDAAALFALAFALRCGVWLASPDAGDWDALFYGSVAGNLASGRGFVLDGLASLAWLPPALPGPAYAYWMPGAPLIYVLGAILSPAHGPSIVACAAAAATAPLAAALAGATGADRDVARGAGVIAAIGGVWGPVLGTPDVHSLVAVAGGAAWLAAARGSVGGAAAGAIAVALLRNDGLFFAPFVALAFERPRDRAIVAGAGPAAAAAWLAYVRWTLGGDALDGRAIAARASTYAEVWNGHVDRPLGWGARAWGIAAHGGPEVALWIAALGLGLAVPALLVGAGRRDRWSRAAAAAAIALPLVDWALAPAVAGHGTVYRTGAVVLVPAAVWIANGAAALGAWGKEARDYPRALLPAITYVGYAAVALGLAIRGGLVADRIDPDCAIVAAIPGDRPVYASRPLPIIARCGRAAVLLTRTLDPDRARAIADRYGICDALAADGPADEASAAGDDIVRILGWSPVGDRVFHRPDCR